ncbi:hypothetical protein ABEW34_21430 [Paenibacillus algorifonticola]|uniref:hypothetical protein n=1 Tax=Paenibacillus algorifonticola TaxID=684063 RepID=UPI003D266FA0
MVIVSHVTNQLGMSGFCLFHQALVDSVVEPDPEEVATETGYHPFAYEMRNPNVLKKENGRYAVTWLSRAALP